MNATKDWGAAVDRLGLFVRDVLVAPSVDVVIEIDGEGTQDVGHDDVCYPNVFHDSTAPTPRFQANTAIGADKDAIGNDNIANIAAHFASHDHTAMSMRHSAIGDRNIFAGGAPFGRLGFRARFNGDAIIARINVAIGNAHIATRIGIDAIGVG